MPENGRLLDLGAGQGQDSIYFAKQGFEVTCTDIEDGALEIARTNAEKEGVVIATKNVDLAKPLPFGGDSFEVIYAHLSLHYFTSATTQSLIDEIHRVLVPGGVLAFMVNSVSDPEYGTGEQIEPDYFLTEGTQKRYFSTKTASTFLKAFETIVLDDEGSSYKDQAKGVHNLIRFVGRK